MVPAWSQLDRMILNHSDRSKAKLIATALINDLQVAKSSSRGEYRRLRRWLTQCGGQA